MTAYQTGLFGAPQPPTTAPNKVLIPRTRLLAFADACEANGEKWKASAIRTACFGAYSNEDVAVSAALPRLWGMTVEDSK